MKLKNVILFILIATMATSCMMYKGYYDLGLQEVERPDDAKEQYGESKIVTLEEDGNIDDIIVPTDNIYYISGQYGGWQTKPLFPNKANTEEELNNLTQSYIDKTVQVVLPIEIEDTVNEYIFKFKVDSFKRL